ncbi:MAG TPA: hypothetical protein P5121_10265 [Caldilineaceae bacterium]|nr:hypothetical protein [Caldilineaceae bacterium]
MTVPPREPYNDPWHRRYWGYSNRPYSGCGCLYLILIFLLIWWVVSLFVPGIAIWSPYF